MTLSSNRLQTMSVPGTAQPWYSRPLVRSLTVILIFVIALVPRLMGLGAFLADDEVLWFSRSIAFWQALLKFDLANTYQQVHPNVTTMWITGLILGLASKLGVDLSNASWIPIARLSVVLVTSVGVSCLYLVLTKLFPRWGAFLIACIVALDPFYLANSRMLHVHAASATYLVASYLVLLVACVKSEGVRWIIFSGVLGGLALLTNINAATLLPAAILTLFLQPQMMKRLLSGSRLALTLRRSLAHSVLWGATAVFVFIIAWPAMWVKPAETLERLAIGLEWGVTKPHGANLAQREIDAMYGNNAEILQYISEIQDDLPVDEPQQFFMGRRVRTPGLLFCPLTWLYRSTPLTLFMLGGCLIALSIRLVRGTHTTEDVLAIYLLLYAIAFMLVLGISAKQIQRYILPSCLFIDIVAGIYLLEAVQRLQQVGNRRKGLMGRAGDAISFSIGCVAMILLHWLPYAHTHPYEITYYQPLFGGHSKAAEVFMLGSGEGLSLAADYLNEISSGKDTVATKYGQFLAPFYQGRAITQNRFSTYDLQDANVVLVYIRERQRQESPELETILADLTPEYVVTLNEVDYVWIYRLPGERETAVD